MDDIRSADVVFAELDLVIAACVAVKDRADETKLTAGGQNTYDVQNRRVGGEEVRMYFSSIGFQGRWGRVN